MDEIKDISQLIGSSAGGGLLPVFIGGCDRSGTTLLGAMLGAHSQCVCTPESQFVIEILRQTQLDGALQDASSIVSAINRHPRFKLWNVPVHLDELSALGQASCSNLVELIVKKYGWKIGKPSPRYWVDHTPSNVKYAASLFSLFPEARLVHIIRDGRGVAASLLKVAWGPNTIESAAGFWLKTLTYGLAAEASYGRQRVLRIKYEDLVSDTVLTLQELCRFIGLEFETLMIDGQGFVVPAFTKNQHQLVGHKPDPARANAWGKELSLRQIEIFEYLTGNILEYLGYAPMFGIKARKMTPGESLMSKLKTAQMYANNLGDRFKLWFYTREKYSR